MNINNMIRNSYIRIDRHLQWPDPVLKGLSRDLAGEISSTLEFLISNPASVDETKACHRAVEHLSNVKISVDNELRRKDVMAEARIFLLIGSQIEKTETILRSGIFSGSDQASEIAVRTLNHLFRAQQKLNQKFSLKTRIEIPQIPDVNGDVLSFPAENKQKILPAPEPVGKTPKMVIPSVLLYQFYQSLFPAEKMLVGAGNRNNGSVEITAVFEVTGIASIAGVQADPRRLSRALIAMTETDNYFALWLHSHPGRGAGATHPSSIDRNQEIDWLRDYSSGLVSAIMVEDRYIRFWGRALEEGRISVEITGPGVSRERENIYKLES